MLPNGSGGLQIVSGGWFLVVVDGFGWLRMVSGGFGWFQVVYYFSSYGFKLPFSSFTLVIVMTKLN